MEDIDEWKLFFISSNVRLYWQLNIYLEVKELLSNPLVIRSAQSQPSLLNNTNNYSCCTVKNTCKKKKKKKKNIKM